MSIRAVSLTLVPALILLAAASTSASATDAATRAAEERALRAQIDRMDDDLQKLVSKMSELQADKSASHAAEVSALRDQIHRMDREQELIENRLHELEKDDPPAAREHRQAEPPPAPTTATPSPPQVQPPAPPAPAPAPPSAPPPPPPGPTLRQAADPAPYEKAAGSRVSMFRYNSYRWVPVGTRQLVVYNTYDDAYLLEFASDCPGLLSAERIKVENFSTKVVVGRDGVLANGQRCAIADIRELNVGKLPR